MLHGTFLDFSLLNIDALHYLHFSNHNPMEMLEDYSDLRVTLFNFVSCELRQDTQS